jgi:Leucine-rich repeat (LRR) protein
VQYFPNLVELDAKNTTRSITQRPESIGHKIPKLKTLHLDKNGIKSIPPSIAILSDTLTRITVYDYHLQGPPLDIAEQGNKAILEYLKALLIRTQGLTHEHKRPAESTTVLILIPMDLEIAYDSLKPKICAGIDEELAWTLLAIPCLCHPNKNHL